MELFIEAVIWIAYIISLYCSIFLFLVYLEKKKFFDLEQSSTEPEKFPFISIIVPAYNEEKSIIGTLESIEQIDYPKDQLEVLVVSNGSSDKTPHLVKEFIKNKKEFKLFSLTQKGKALALNYGLSKCSGEFFACLDADSLVDKATLRKMLSLYYKENDPKLAIITPAMKVYKPSTILQKIQWLEYIVIIFISRLASHLDSLYVAPGPFSLYKTRVIKEIGGFDEKNITEDQEIAYRVQKHQYKIKQCFDGYVYTIAPSKIKAFYRQRKRWYLGSIICLHKYKEMIGNKKYGDFGVMQLVKNVVGYSLAFIGMILLFYFVIDPSMEWLKRIFILKENIISYLLTLNFRITFLDFFLADLRKWFIVLFLSVIGAIFFYVAHKNAKEKMTSVGWIPLIPYFAFYYMLKGTIFLLSFVHFSRKKRSRW